MHEGEEVQRDARTWSDRQTHLQAYTLTSTHTQAHPTFFAYLDREWTETYSYDFRDERMMVPFKEITQSCATHTDDVRAAVLDVQRVLFKKVQGSCCAEAWQRGVGGGTAGRAK